MGSTARSAVAVGLVLALAGCQGPTVADDPPSPSAGEQAPGDKPAQAEKPATRQSSRETYDLMQAQVMDFADDFTLRLADVTDRIEARQMSLEARIAIHRLRYTVAHGLTMIATSANPRVALMDSVVVMSLQRRLVEERLVPAHFQETPWLTDVFKSGEDQVKSIAAQSLTPEQMAEIQTLVDKWVEDNPYRHYAAYVRLNDFARKRQTTEQAEGNGRSQSIFGLLFLDPLAGLDPTTRELEQTRLFAERALFYLQRMPQLISWQAELLYIDSASEPEVVRALQDVSRLTESIEMTARNITELREQAPELIEAERTAAIDQAMTRFFEELARERSAALDDLGRRAESLESTLAELDRTFGSGERFSAEATGLVESIQRLTETIQAMQGEPDPDAEPTTIADYERLVGSATTLVERLDSLVADIDALASSDAWDQRRVTIDQTMADTQARLDATLDRAFWRGLILVLVLVFGLLGAGLTLKLVPGRRSA